MSKLISISTQMTNILDEIRNNKGCSYTEAIQELSTNNKTFEDKLKILYDPLQEMCIEIHPKMQHATELVRVIIILLNKTEEPKPKIEDLIGKLTEYLQEMQNGN